MRTPLVLAAALLAALPVAARAEDDASREADMFGGGGKKDEPKKDEAPATGSDAAREADVFGSTPKPDAPPGDDHRAGGMAELAPVDENALVARAVAANDKLAIGGRFFNQDQLSVHEHDSFRSTTLSLPTLLDVYLDGRPNDRLRAYARGRVVFDPTQVDGRPLAFGSGTQSSLSASLDQLWLKWDVYQRVFFTLGRQRIKWGAGRFWNPTDFLNSQKLNALALLDTRLGTTLFKVHVPVESLGWNFYAIANLTGASRPDDAGFALRGEFLLGPMELTLSSQVRRAATPGGVPPATLSQVQAGVPGASSADFAANSPSPSPDVGTQLQLGADLSTAVGPFDVHLEGALTHGNKALFLTGPLTATNVVAAFTTPAGNAPLPAEYRDDQWIAQVVGGADVSVKYSDQDAVNLGVEYFYNGAGVSDRALYNSLILVGNFTPFYLGRHYLAVSASLPNPGDWNNTSFTLSNLANLSDHSYLARLDYSVLALTNLVFRAFVNYHYGNVGEFKLGGAFTGLPTGTSAAVVGVLKPTLVDAGVGFILSL